ncbi:pre-rRNA-processing protein ESF2 [Quillaja saponaria]|uniref:Pre-rRNA-processing protein ESF2 n=1 Tax=Quillaja saponaria TaxID=32244 RepID=A0AAD7M699_QUISA|nr:pre-rRNA-processing protein ESF2 [Quillaja saponaria]KAJ7970734.1 pre-rRNA-processing protein ESF2 [Quillaja saponaria]
MKKQKSKEDSSIKLHKEEIHVHTESPQEEVSRISNEDEAVPTSQKIKKKNFLKEPTEVEKKKDEKTAITASEELNSPSDEEKLDARKIKRKKKLLKEAAKADKRGVCYMSRIPPHMDHVKLRHILSQYGEIQRIYLAPEDPTAQIHPKKARKFRDQGFSEGWIEFSNKVIAKRVANMLNGEQIGGKKRSSFYYDLWNIKYLSKFKWDDLTEELAYKKAIREQKLTLDISAAKRQRDFYLSKVDQSRALSSIEERLKKKQKVQQESAVNPEHLVNQQVAKVRQFHQIKPVAGSTAENKHRLSEDVLDAVFGGL